MCAAQNIRQRLVSATLAVVISAVRASTAVGLRKSIGNDSIPSSLRCTKPKPGGTRKCLAEEVFVWPASGFSGTFRMRNERPPRLRGKGGNLVCSSGPATSCASEERARKAPGEIFPDSQSIVENRARVRSSASATSLGPARNPGIRSGKRASLAAGTDSAQKLRSVICACITVSMTSPPTPNNSP
jgi:hypothetical protein